MDITTTNYFDQLINAIKINFTEDEVNRIPITGSLVALSNRPIGLIEELIIYKILKKRRNYFFFFNNMLLNTFQELSKNHFVDNSLNEIEDTIANNSCMVIFPVGYKSNYKNKQKTYVDSEWNKPVLKKLFKLNTNILTFYISIENADFKDISNISDINSLNIEDLISKFNNTEIVFNIRIGKVIKSNNWQFSNYNQFSRFLRAKLYSLSSKLKVDNFYIENKVEKIIDPIENTLIDEELQAIYNTNCIGEQGNFRVYICKAKKIPNTILEIGRLREISFRQVGEGTNKSIDLDEYDLYYLHLFIYDVANKQVSGAYRIGDGGYIMKTTGRRGFYVNSLFKIKKEFSFLLEDSIELGRSFVRSEYQNQRLPLFLLWKGISYFLVSHSNIKYIIGPVSISNSYSKLSKSLIIEYVVKYHWDKFLAQFITPRIPFESNYNGLDYEVLIESTNNSIKSLEEIIEDIDPNHTKVPLLLKKYFAQNARILCFNNDPKFNDALDGFMLLDIRDLSKETLETFQQMKDIEY
jgi:hypothetical protein